MADETIRDQSELTSLAADDSISVWDESAGAMKRIQFTNFLNSNVTQGAGYYFATDKVRARSSSGLRLEDDAGNLGIFIQDSTGYVGIGTNAPVKNMHVSANAPEQIWSATGGTVDSRAWRVRIGTNGNFNLEAINDDASSGGSAIAVVRSGVTVSTIVLAQSAGQVGIGTATPGALLGVAGSIRGAYDANTTSYFGRAAIGYDGATSDWATFSHIDQNAAASFALAATPAGATWLQAASGQNIIFARAGFSLGLWDTSSNFVPGLDNTQDCGKSGARWNDIWAGNATIQTSDERDKVAIKASDLGLAFIRALDPISWIWANVDQPAITEKRLDEHGQEYDHVIRPAVKQTHTRPHYGLSAQQVRATLDTLGVADFAGYIYDESTDAYALRYAEFIGPIIAAIQELATAVEQLQGSKA